MDNGEETKSTGNDRTDESVSGSAKERINLKRIWTVLKLTPQVLQLVWRVTPVALFLLLVLRALSALVPTAQLWLSKVLIDAIVAAVGGSPTARGTPYVFSIVGAHALLMLLSNGIIQVQTYVQDYVGRRLSLHSDMTLRQKVLSLDLAMIENPAFHNHYVRASVGAGSKPLSLVSAAMNVVEQGITLMSLGAVFLVLKWPITLILIVTVIPNTYVLLKYSQKSYDIQRARTHEGRRATYHATLLSSPNAFKEIKLLQIGRRLLSSYQKYKWREFMEDRALLKKRQTESFFSESVSTLAYYGAYAYIVLEALRGRITIGDVAFYSGAFLRCQNAIRALVAVIPNAHDINVYVKDYLDLQQAEPELVRPSGAKPVRRPIERIEFRGVSFCYPRTNKWVFRDVNLTFGPGQRVGLVGENGAGKTTLVKLLCRIYEPTEGAIYVDGVDLRELDIDQWHTCVGVIFQDFVTYLDKVRDNIGYGQVSELDNLPRIMEAARKGQADELIRSLPLGYDTILGREFLTGEQLSGGQLQRLALSRLFMRKADVLILDEPSFALDPRSEYEIYKTFNEHCDGKISLLISHRFSTMRIADRIIVLDGGVIEDGTHEDLMRRGGVYAELFEIQHRAIGKVTGDPTVPAPVR